MEISTSYLLYISGDWNVKIGKGTKELSFMGTHGRGWRNMSGATMANFANNKKLFICNTAFQHTARHITTWIGERRNSDGHSIKIYNKIDDILSRQSQKALLCDARTYRGTLTSSDHKLLVIKLFLKRRFWINRVKNKHREARFAVELLRNYPVYRNNYSAKISQTIESINLNLPAESMWNKLKNKIKSVAKHTIGQFPKPSKEYTTLSHIQKDLRIKHINTQNQVKAAEFKIQRNKIMREIKKKCQKNYETRLQNLANEVGKYKNESQMFASVKMLARKKKSENLTIHDELGRTIYYN
ncbi:uncharacterized protein LOC115229945 [Octopus sinensis]|uniref:Uncharacterized protein LOC115229945 n=1 Tax=Octopus sinensis TaxID=2607531 RepID=A0A6P7U1D0_9MOLL|nr:uncharacterized protein LOC115229945 [Octopus sinensis]